MVDRLSEWGLYEYRPWGRREVVCGNRILSEDSYDFNSEKNDRDYAREAGMPRLVHKELCGW